MKIYVGSKIELGKTNLRVIVTTETPLHDNITLDENMYFLINQSRTLRLLVSQFCIKSIAYLFFHDVVVYVVVSFIALLAHVEKN